MSEYIPEKNVHNKKGVEQKWKTGEIVVVLSNKNERGVWPLGRVIRVLPHAGDGIVRKLEIKTADNKVIIRSVLHILKLEVETSS